MTIVRTGDRQARQRRSQDVRQLVACLAAAVGLAVLTGPDGTKDDPAHTLQELVSVRLLVCAGLCLALWATLVLSRRGLVNTTMVRSVPAQVRTRIHQTPTLRYSTTGAVVVGAIAIPPFLSLFWQEVLVTQTGIYILLAVGLNVVVGWAGLLDLGYVAFYAIGAYTVAYLTGSLPPAPPIELNPFYAMIFAIAACALAGLVLGAPTLRLRGDYLAIVTLGFGEIVRLTALNADDITNGSRGAPNIDHPSIDLGFFDYNWGLDPLPYWYLFLTFAVIIVFLFNRLEHSRVGRAWAAIREDEVAAQANGVRTFRLKLLAFSIGASTSGVAGVLYASKVSFINPSDFLLQFSIFVLAYVIFGGMGSLPGVILGAAALTLLPQYLRDVVPPADRPIYLGGILVLMMIYRPSGLLPSRRRQMELSDHDTPASETAAVAPAGSMGKAQK